ncbi:type II toxin-antitoxin system RelE/ParE family toxin [Salmonella enterica]|uniref:type II toxin-antitoxin system RelE/ParE family toxin n=1 Tax=Enterobacteriaceae TaxID=543 RepID=UPI0009499833|nr:MULTISPECIES: type II toxin-antitoxin system RelE/ParE family toxin [Enterobacteriaceae]EBS7633691.1 type II toxin-antitoxin system RelE/ParE family toxin [Salmonella enterica]MDO8235610.1 type II toxin-antitoxin system RelE/ParE family toxin [Citrobacter werkmanii]HCM9143902.1 type II toxin-antitoxin system RelE/ParE family toxin [Enterobacter hormaechei subsp. steigerwaltii]
MEIKWLRKAIANLEAEFRYITEDDPQAAERFVNEVWRLTQLLKEQPAMGREGRVPETRELILHNYPYIIPYRVRNNTIQILRVFHTHRKLPRKW